MYFWFWNKVWMSPCSVESFCGVKCSLRTTADEASIVVLSSPSEVSKIAKGYPGRVEGWFCVILLQGVWTLVGFKVLFVRSGRALVDIPPLHNWGGLPGDVTITHLWMLAVPTGQGTASTVDWMSMRRVALWTAFQCRARKWKEAQWSWWSLAYTQMFESIILPPPPSRFCFVPHASFFH